jgi:hypothetical protein
VAKGRFVDAPLNRRSWYFSADDGMVGREPFVYFPPGTVVTRHVFDNNSFFDGNDPTPNAGDDAAMDATKTALLPG